MASGTAVRTSRAPGAHRKVRLAEPSRGERSGFRPDVEGLRALAILPVLAYHAAIFLGPGGGPLGLVAGLLRHVPGGFLGVDVFFVISGYLITGLLVTEAGATGRIHFGRFYARRARRILPAATATLLVTLAVSVVVLPAARLGTAAGDVLWAAVFNADVHFGTAHVDYMGVASAPSPVLHYWSLNDEEKFYLVWPAVLAVVAWGTHRLGRTLTASAGPGRQPSLRPIAFVAMLAIAVPSLLWSQHLVDVGAVSGYYAAPARAFELAAGGLLAIAVPLVELTPRPVRVVGAIAGFVVIVACMLTYDGSTPFPGYHALPVVLGSVLVIAGHPGGVVSRGLSRPPVRWVGRVSYSLYLWHWPVLVLAAAAAGGRLSPPQDLACVAAAVALAWLSYRVIEQPPQRSALMRPTRAALVVGLVAVLLTVAAAVGVRAHADSAVAASDARAAKGITRVVTKDNHLLLVGDSITTRGAGPLQAALKAAGWDFRIDALGGRPIVSGARATWTPHCVPADRCGGDRALAGDTIPGTVVMALGSNAVEIVRHRVAPPTATDSGLRSVRDRRGRFVIKGQDSPAQVAAEVTRIMQMVPRSTTVYWVGLWLDDATWGNVTWRASNRAIATAAAAFPNARFLDWAAYVDAHHVPYLPDGSHPDPNGMVLRAHWLVSQLH